MTGLLSFLLVDLSALLGSLPLPAGEEMPPPLVLKLLSLVQPTIILLLMTLVGTGLASKVELSAPAAEAAARSENLWVPLKSQLVPGVIGGVAGGAAILLNWQLWQPFLPPEFVARSQDLGNMLPLATRLLYGGVTEEILLRWGVITLLVWIAWRLFQNGEGKPRAVFIISAIFISSILFGVAHLPLAYGLAPAVTLPVIFYIIVGNSLFGFIAGYLYWRKGLESAILAHILAHVVMIAVNLFVS